MTEKELQTNIEKLLNKADCILLEKCPTMGTNGIISLAEKYGLEFALSNICDGCGVKSEGKCSGRQKEINKTLQSPSK